MVLCFPHTVSTCWKCSLLTLLSPRRKGSMCPSVALLFNPRDAPRHLLALLSSASFISHHLRNPFSSPLILTCEIRCKTAFYAPEGFLNPLSFCSLAIVCRQLGSDKLIKTFYRFGQLAGVAEVPTVSPARQTPTPRQRHTCPGLCLFRVVPPVVLYVNGSQAEKRTLGLGFRIGLCASGVTCERFIHTEHVSVQHSTS